MYWYAGRGPGVAEVVSEVGGDAFGIHAQRRQFRQPGCWRASFYGLDRHGGKVRCMCWWDGKHPAPGRMASRCLSGFTDSNPWLCGQGFAEHHRNDSRAIANCKALSMLSGNMGGAGIPAMGRRGARRRIEEITGTIDGGLAGRSSRWADQSGRANGEPTGRGATQNSGRPVHGCRTVRKRMKPATTLGFDGDNVAARVAGQYQMVG